MKHIKRPISLIIILTLLLTSFSNCILSVHADTGLKCLDYTINADDGDYFQVKLKVDSYYDYIEVSVKNNNTNKKTSMSCELGKKGTYTIKTNHKIVTGDKYKLWIGGYRDGECVSSVTKDNFIIYQKTSYKAAPKIDLRDKIWYISNSSGVAYDDHPGMRLHGFIYLSKNNFRDEFWEDILVEDLGEIIDELFEYVVDKGLDDAIKFISKKIAGKSVGGVFTAVIGVMSDTADVAEIIDLFNMVENLKDDEVIKIEVISQKVTYNYYLPKLKLGYINIVGVVKANSLDEYYFHQKYKSKSSLVKLTPANEAILLEKANLDGLKVVDEIIPFFSY